MGAGHVLAEVEFRLLVIQEQGRGRERHQADQARGDERDHVGDAQRPAQRLRDIVQQLLFAMRDRDVVERTDLVDRRVSRGRGLRRCRVRPVAQQLSLEARQDLHERFNQRGIERRPAVLAQGRDGLRIGAGRPLGSIRHHRGETVDHGNDTGAERNVVASQARRVAAAVPALVVREDQRCHRVRERHRLQDLRSHPGMDLQPLELFVRQRALLRQDMLGDRQVADVVQQRRGSDPAHRVFTHPDGARETFTVGLHQLQEVARREVLGVDGEGQRFDDCQLQFGHLPHLPLFFGDALRVHPVAAIRDVGGNGEDPDPERAALIRDDDREHGDEGAYVVRRGAPEEIPLPDPQHIIARRERDGARHEQAVEEEIDRGRHDRGVDLRDDRPRAHEEYQGVRPAGGSNRDTQGDHAEGRPMPRIADFHPERALAPGRRDGDRDRGRRTQPEQRREVHHVRERQGRTAPGQRQGHLHGGRDGRNEQQPHEQGKLLLRDLCHTVDGESGADRHQHNEVDLHQVRQRTELVAASLARRLSLRVAEEHHECHDVPP